MMIYFYNYRREALKGLLAMLGSVLPVRQQLLSSLSTLDSLSLQGNLLIDLSIVANIPANLISGSNYEDISVGIIVNHFEATASFSSRNFSLDLPLTMHGEIVSFGLTDASFSIDYFVNTQGPIDVVDFLLDDLDIASIDFNYGGTLEASLPLSVGIAGTNIALDLLISDPNLFAPDKPVVDYAIDMCDFSSSMSNLFDQLKIQIVQAIVPFEGLAITSVRIDKIMDPLVSRVENALTDFTDGMNIALSSADCSRRILQTSNSDSSSPSSSPSYAPNSLIETILDAISSVNAALDSSGIVLSAKASPYFKADIFSIGVSVSLSASIEQTASDLLEMVEDYISNSTDPSGDSSISKKLGLGDSSSPDTSAINLDGLLSTVAFTAGFDMTFGIDLSLSLIQDAIINSSPIDEALQKGIALHIDTWGAFADIIADPIDLIITLFGRQIQIRDSHFALAVELRSRGKFSATIEDMILGGDAVNASLLTPDLTIPLSTEFVFDIPATDSITVSPIISVFSENLVDEGLSFNYDLDMGTFLNNEYMGENTLINLLQNSTTFLQEIETFKLELNVAGDTPSELDGFFSMANQLNDLGNEVLTYIDLVNQGAWTRS